MVDSRGAGGVRGEISSRDRAEEEISSLGGGARSDLWAGGRPTDVAGLLVAAHVRARPFRREGFGQSGRWLSGAGECSPVALGPAADQRR